MLQQRPTIFQRIVQRSEAGGPVDEPDLAAAVEEINSGHIPEEVRPAPADVPADIPAFLREGRQPTGTLPANVDKSLETGIASIAEGIALKANPEPTLVGTHLNVAGRMVDYLGTRTENFQKIIDLATEGLRQSQVALEGYQGLQKHLEDNEFAKTPRQLTKPAAKPRRARKPKPATGQS